MMVTEEVSETLGFDSELMWLVARKELSRLVAVKVTSHSLKYTTAASFHIKSSFTVILQFYAL
jgi:hypothetical protein